MGILGGIYGLFQLIYEEGEKEWLDEAKYREGLNELNLQLESGEISEEAFEEAEEEILERLKEIRNYKKEHGITDH